LQDDAAQAARLADATENAPEGDLLLAAQADTAAWHGKFHQAGQFTRRAMDVAQRRDANEAAALYEAAAALRDVEAGWRQKARDEATDALKRASTVDVRALVALALARAGDSSAAEQLATQLDRDMPLGTVVQRYWLPSIRAAIAINRNEAERTIELLEPAASIELGQPTGVTVFLCPVYIRGQGYLMLHNGKAAAAEFQKFVDHRGVVANFPWGAMARLGLARAFKEQGDTAKAKSAYKEFLTLWQDADSDIPIYKEAKAEYAALH